MSRLLRAGFSRLWKDKGFWAGLFFMLGLGIFIVCSKYHSKIQYNELARLDDAMFNYVVYAGLVSAIFCSMFLGTEYSDGTIRNKLIVGHLRSSIYLSNWLTSLAASMLMVTAFFISYGTLGSLLLDEPGAPLRKICFYIFVSIFTAASYVSVFSMLAMLITKKSVSAVVGILVFLGLLVLAMTIEARLEAPEFISAYSMTINGVEQINPEPNPHYLQPHARNVYQAILDLLPTGQSLQLSRMSVLHPFWMMVYSAAVSVITSVLGISAFRRKNLK